MSFDNEKALIIVPYNLSSTECHFIQPISDTPSESCYLHIISIIPNNLPPLWLEMCVCVCLHALIPTLFPTLGICACLYCRWRRECDPFPIFAPLRFRIEIIRVPLNAELNLRIPLTIELVYRRRIESL